LDITRELPIKKPLSAYVHFLNEGRQRLNKSHPSIGVIEQTTILGKRWREVSKGDRNMYNQKAKMDRLRYQKELQQITLTPNSEA
jgi:hypothetical protein